MRAHIVLVTLLTAVLPAGVRAHEVLHEVERGRAVAVRVYESDGEPLADAEFEVFSPAEPGAPHLRGSTDRGGWLAFVPDAPGRWRVKVVDASGHGLDTAIEVAASGVPASGAGSNAGGAAFVLRPVLGVGLIAAVFAVLVVLARRKSAHR